MVSFEFLSGDNGWNFHINQKTEFYSCQIPSYSEFQKFLTYLEKEDSEDSEVFNFYEDEAGERAQIIISSKNKLTTVYLGFFIESDKGVINGTIEIEIAAKDMIPAVKDAIKNHPQNHPQKEKKKITIKKK